MTLRKWLCLLTNVTPKLRLSIFFGAMSGGLGVKGLSARLKKFTNNPRHLSCISTLLNERRDAASDTGNKVIKERETSPLQPPFACCAMLFSVFGRSDNGLLGASITLIPFVTSTEARRCGARSGEVSDQNLILPLPFKLKKAHGQRWQCQSQRMLPTMNRSRGCGGFAVEHMTAPILFMI